MSENDRCLRMADECEHMAKRITSAEDRATLFHLARLWRELADTAVTAVWVEEVTSRRKSAPGKHS